MPFHTSHDVVPAVVQRASVLRRRALDPPRAYDAVARGAAYRRFLQRTQDVVVSAVDYPGGLAALIRDRESVTLRLVRLLRND